MLKIKKFFVIVSLLTLFYLIVSAGNGNSLAAIGENNLSSQWVNENLDNPMIKEAQRSFRDGRYDESIKYIETFFANEPSLAKVNDRIRALSYVGLASNYVEKAVRNESEKNKYCKKAKAYFENASKLLGSDMLNISICSGLGFIYLQLGDYDQAVKYLNKGLKGYPLGTYKKEHIDIYTNLGYAYLNKKNFKESTKYFDKALETAPSGYDGSLSIYVGLSSCYRELGDYDQAVKYLNKGLKDYSLATYKKEHTDIYINLGYAYLNKKNFKESSEYFNKALETAPPGYPILPAYLGLSSCYRELGDYDQAVKYLNKGLKDYPLATYKKEHTDIYTDLGYAYLNKKNFKESSEYFNKALETAPPGYPILPAYLGLSSCYREAGDLNVDLKLMRYFLEKFLINSNAPVDQKVSIISLFCLYKMKEGIDENEAVKIAKMLKDNLGQEDKLYLDENIIRILDKIYNIFLELYKEPDNIKDALRKAGLYEDNSVFSHRFLGYIYLKKDLLNEAIQEFGKIIKINPNFTSAYIDLKKAIVGNR
jgi:tetratricopeptide (TPR) repeat protein